MPAFDRRNGSPAKNFKELGKMDGCTDQMDELGTVIGLALNISYSWPQEKHDVQSKNPSFNSNTGVIQYACRIRSSIA